MNMVMPRLIIFAVSFFYLDGIALAVLTKIHAYGVIQCIFSNRLWLGAIGLSRSTALQYATQNKDRKLTDLAIRYGVNINHRDCLGETAIFSSVTHGDLPAVLSLVEGGLDVNIPDKHGLSPLLWSIICYNASLKRNGDCDDIAHRLEIVGKIAIADRDINYRCKYWDTALSLSITNSLVEIADLLLRLGANPYAVTASGKNSFELIYDSNNQEMMDMIKIYSIG